MNFKKLIEISYALQPRYATGRNFHCTFLLKKSRLLSVGWNNYIKSHPINLNFNYKDKNGDDARYHVGLHSEASAWLRYGQENTSDLTWVNIRIMRCGGIGLARFCVGCQNLIKQAGFKRAFYSVAGGRFEEFE